MVFSRPRSILLALVLLVALPVHSQELSSLLHNAPDEAESAQAFVVDGVLTGTQRILRVVLRYRGPGEPYSESPMELQYGDLYRGTIPGVHMAAPGVEYYVEGFTPGGERVPLFKSATRPARVLIKGEPPARPPPPPARAPVEPPVASRPAKPEAKSESARKPDAPRRSEPARKAGADDAMAALTAELPTDAEPSAAPPSTPPAPERPSRAPESRPDPARSQMEEELALYTAEDTLALATRHEESVKKVPAIAASFGREQIRSLGARTVADVLDVVPGLSISRDVQGFYRTAVRGLRNDAEVLFLLNGHRLNNFFDGKVLMNLPVENLERIEVIRGPGSSLYGAGAFLGVVNLVTQRDEGLSFSGSVGGVPKKNQNPAPAADLHLSGATTFEHLKIFGDGD
ncbi:MAG: TonB-dependent receptor plug domain-containing protein, partial [Cystobacter sp.]